VNDLDIRLAERTEHSKICHALYRRQHVDDLERLGLVHLEVGAGHFHAVLSLDPSDRLFHVVADVLREVEDHSGECLLEFPLYNLSQLGLGQPARPVPERFERREELEIVETGHVSAIVGTPELRDHRNHFGVSAQDGAHSTRVLRRLIERDRHRQGGADPEVPFFELRHELPPKQGEQGDTEEDWDRLQHQREPGLAQGGIKERIVDPVEETHQSVLLLLVR